MRETETGTQGDIAVGSRANITFNTAIFFFRLTKRPGLPEI